MLAIHLPKSVEDKLSTLADRTGQSKALLAATAITDYLDFFEEELTLDEEEALGAYEAEKKSGTLLTYSLEEVRNRLGLDR